LPDKILGGATLLVSGERIVAFGKREAVNAPEGVEVIDAKGCFVGPGFVDIHVHGAGPERDTSFHTAAAAEYFLAHGETTILASPWYRMDAMRMLEAVRSIKGSISKTKNVRGIYFEGPYTNPNYGAGAASNPWRHGILADEYKPIADEAGTLARVWVVAPEREGIAEFLAYVKRVNPQAVIAVGHSAATPAQIRALGEYKPTLQTHAMDATGKVATPSGAQQLGPDEYCLVTDGVICELICDSQGLHVHDDMLKLLLHCKGVERIALVTDSASSQGGAPPAEFAHAADVNFNPEGELAGSKLTMDVAFRNIIDHAGVDVREAFLMASTNPARAIGMDGELGSIAVGKRADLVILSEALELQQVIIGGELYKK
jgi:N-acetylglucosamine-6-phosphate deacetylase